MLGFFFLEIGRDYNDMTGVKVGREVDGTKIEVGKVIRKKWDSNVFNI